MGACEKAEVVLDDIAHFGSMIAFSRIDYVDVVNDFCDFCRGKWPGSRLIQGRNGANTDDETHDGFSHIDCDIVIIMIITGICQLKSDVKSDSGPYGKRLILKSRPVCVVPGS